MKRLTPNQAEQARVETLNRVLEGQLQVNEAAVVLGKRDVTHGESWQHIGGKEPLPLLVGAEAADQTRADLVEGELRSLVELAALRKPDGNRSVRSEIIAIEIPERVLGVPCRRLFEDEVTRRSQGSRVDVPLSELHRVDQLVGGDPLPIIIGMPTSE